MKVIKPPNKREVENHPSIFLAGSIEMGKAEDWQTRTEKFFEPYLGTIFNPRRDDWDESWKQTITNPNFNEQVNWEMDGLEEADFIIFHFEPDTQSPITLAELGMYYNSSKVFVSCPKGFWRRGNIEIMCDRAGIELYDSLDGALEALQKAIEGKYDERGKDSKE